MDISNEVVCFDDPVTNHVKNSQFIIYSVGRPKGPWAYNPTLTKWLTFNAEKYNAIIIHGLWLYHSFAANKTIQRFKKRGDKEHPKLFIMPHGMLDPYFQKASNRRLKAIRNWFFWYLIEQYAINNADGILFTCEQELQLARKTFRSYHPKLEWNVGFGIPAPPPHSHKLTREFHARCIIKFDQPYWLFLSRIHEKKGVDMLIKAYQRLFQKHEAVPPLVVAGPGLDTPFGKKITALAKPIPQILFTGMLTGNAKWGAFYGCEVFILPSHQENFGIAIVEAMACGKPVLISDKVNIWQEIIEGGGGLVGVDTEEETYNLLKRWLNLTKEEKETMAAAANRTYKNTFTIEKAAVRMAATLKSV